MWACNGTFKCSPDLYYQFFTIHIVVRSVSIPRVFVLLPVKTDTTYNKLFSTLKKIEPMLDPEQLMIDFEKAAIKAFSYVFPAANITGCLFHLAKNIYRQFVNLGFKLSYQTESKFNLKIKCFTA